MFPSEIGFRNIDKRYYLHPKERFKKLLFWWDADKEWFRTSVVVGCIEPIRKEILWIDISIERNMFVTEMLISKLIKIYDKHQVSTDGGIWYNQSCRF